MTKIYIIFGVYNHESDWMLKAFKNEEKAKQFLESCTHETQQLAKTYTQLRDDFEAEKQETGLTDAWIKAAGEGDNKSMQETLIKIRELDSFKKMMDYSDTKHSLDSHVTALSSHGTEYLLGETDLED